MKRYALVTLRTKRGSSTEEEAEVVKNYLPRNYKVIGTGKNEIYEGGYDDVAVIEGVDDHGWTLDRHVIPRLGSGLFACEEVDLTHPCVANQPAFPEFENETNN